jgi:hypothetical protein
MKILTIYYQSEDFATFRFGSTPQRRTLINPNGEKSIQIANEKLNHNPQLCPHCKSESLIIIKVVEPERGPPKKFTYA